MSISTVKGKLISCSLYALAGLLWLDIFTPRYFGWEPAVPLTKFDWAVALLCFSIGAVQFGLAVIQWDDERAA